MRHMYGLRIGTPKKTAADKSEHVNCHVTAKCRSNQHVRSSTKKSAIARTFAGSVRVVCA